MVLGWTMASPQTDLFVDAVTVAVHWRGVKVPGVIHHCDRAECTSHQLERERRRHGVLAIVGSAPYLGSFCRQNARFTIHTPPPHQENT